MSKQVFKWLGRHKLLGFLIIIVLAGVGYFAFHSYRVYADKQKFQEARLAIDTVYKEAIAKVGKPDNTKSADSCSRHFEEWGGGEISCFVDTSFIYGVADRNEANLKFKQIQSIVAAHPDLFKPTQALASEITDLAIVDEVYKSAFDKYVLNRPHLGKLDCSFNYVFDTPREMDLDIKSGEHGLQIYIGCYGRSTRPFYPISN